MHGLAKAFFTSALAYGVLGMLLGLHMGMSEDHGQMPTHAHILVIGWVSFAIFGLFYASYEAVVPRRLAQVHFWLAQVSFAAIVVGLWLIYSGRPQFGPVAAISSTAYAVSFLIFAYVARCAMRGKAE
jgi:hypothetical protein